MEKKHEADEVPSSVTDKAKRVEEVMQRAEYFYLKDEVYVALKELNKAVSLDPKNAKALFFRGQVKHKLGRFESALEDLNAAHDLLPHNEVTIYFRAQVYYQLNRMRDVYVDYSLCEELKSRHLYNHIMDRVRSTLLEGVPLCEFQICRLLGEGSFGKVHLATWNGRQVALKTPLNIDRQQVIDEAMTSMKFRHNNIISVESLCNGQNGEISLMMEFAEDGSLYDLLYKQKETLTTEQILMYARDVASGLAYLHKRRVIHRDLKSDNILLFGCKAKIADFGQSRILNKKSVANTITGTVGFMAPEVLAEKDYDEKADIYSFGVLLYEMCTCTILPVIGIEGDRLAKIRNIVMDPDIKQLIMDCCKTNPQQRPTGQRCHERIDSMLEAQWKRQSAAEEKYYAAFRHFLTPWQDFNPDFKCRVVSIFLHLKYGGQETIDTDKLLPSDFAHKEEFINLAKAADINFSKEEDSKNKRQSDAPPKSSCSQQ